MTQRGGERGQRLAPHGLRFQQCEQALNTDTSRLRLRFGQWGRGKLPVVHFYVCVRRESRRYQTSIQPRNCANNRFRLLDDDDVSARGSADEFGTDYAAGERLATGRRDHLVALAPDNHRLCPDAIKTVAETALRDREQQFARHRQLASIAVTKVWWPPISIASHE